MDSTERGPHIHWYLMDDLSQLAMESIEVGSGKLVFESGTKKVRRQDSGGPGFLDRLWAVRATGAGQETGWIKTNRA